MRAALATLSFATLFLLLACPAKSLYAQSGLDPFSSAPVNQLSTPGVTAGAAFLMDLDARFSKETVDGGGKVFATWFADDAVTLGNGKLPVQGRAAIAAGATWSPKTYQLSWTATAATLSPAGDMGYTWGHYDGRATNPDGQQTTTGGRYMTVWRKQKDGQWKVVLEASNDEPAGAGECCRIP